MKHGLMFVAVAVVAALLLTPAAFAAQDTKVVNSTITTTGPGADIAVGSDGKLYASFGQGSTLEVYSGSQGSALTTQKYTVNTGDSVRLTAVAVSKADTVFVVALAGSLNGITSETNARLYAATSGSAISLVGAVHTLDSNLYAGNLEKADSLVVNAIDMVANESFVIVAASVQKRGFPGELSGASTKGAADTVISTTINVFQYDTGTNGIPVRAHVVALDLLTDSDVVTRGAASNLQLALDPVENANNGTTVIWLIQTMAIPATGTSGVDSTGVTLTKLYIGTVAQRGKVVSSHNVFHAFGDSQAIGRVVAEQVSSSDTRARVTVCIANDTVNSTQLYVFEFGDSRHTVLQPTASAFGPVTTGASDSVVRVDFDTGVSSPLMQVRAMSYGRIGSSHSWVLTLGAGLASANPRGDTIIAMSQSTLGGANFTFDTASTVAGYTEVFHDVVRGRGYGQFISSSTHFTAGYDGGPSLAFYITQGSSAESKKKDSGVCLMDRLFGRTSLAKAVFPGLKSFRDTLLGTNLGRKVVSLYYSF